MARLHNSIGPDNLVSHELEIILVVCLLANYNTQHTNHLSSLVRIATSKLESQYEVSLRSPLLR